MSGAPDPKSRSLARGTRRYRRKIASAKDWQRIIAAKLGPCRVCTQPSSNGHGFPKVELHHLVARGQGGNDVEDNIVPLCQPHHNDVTLGEPFTLAALAASLTDSEYAYVVGKLGESGPARLFGVGR
jgi:hypothetical protein